MAAVTDRGGKASVTMPILHLLPCLLLSLAATAQTVAPTAPAAAPAVVAPHIVVETVGPDGWRQRLGPTNLGSLLESQRGRELWQPMTLPVFGMWQQLLGDDGAFALSKQRWLGYGGRVRLWLWFAGQPETGSPDLAGGALLLEDDGHSDLPALAAELQLAMEQRGDWQQRDIDGEALRIGELDGELLTKPIAIGKHFVVAIGDADHLAPALRHARTSALAAGAEPPVPNAPALRWQIDVGALVTMASALDDSDGEVFAALGFDSLTTLHGSVGGAGPHVQVELAGRFANGPRGLLAAFCPMTTGLSPLTALVPAVSDGAKVGRFDLSALYAAFLALVQHSGWSAQADADIREEIRVELGIDPGTDLLAHTTDEIVFLGSPFRDVERVEDIPWALLVKLRDAAKFEAALQKLLTRAKPNLSFSESVQVGNVELRRYGNLLQYDVWLAIGHGVFFLGGGRDGEATLAALVQQAAKLPADAKGSLPASHADLQRHLPPGLSGVAHGDFSALLSLPGEWLSLLFGELLPFGSAAGAADPEQAAALRALLQEHRLTTVRSATGHADSTWRWRLFW